MIKQNKKNMKSVHELNSEELTELRSRYYHQHLDDGSLDEVMGKVIDDEDDIPMEVIKVYYEDTFFVEEDFWCNTSDQK